MKIELVIIWVLHKEGNGRCHFEETISQEFKTLIVPPHPSLNMDLLQPMLLCVIRIFRESLQRIVGINN